jgi:hypothetical protein
MLKIKFLSITILAILFLGATSAAAQSQANSSLNGVRLPEGSLRVNDSDVPAEIRETLAKLIALGNGKLRQGNSEVLVWTGGGFRKANAPKLINRFTENLRSGGWTYAVGEENKNYTVFNSINTSLRRSVIGFFAATDDALLLAWTEMLPASGAPVVNQTQVANNSRPTVENNAGNVLSVGADVNWINVMGDAMPALPQFPALAKKAGRVRGYVKDWTGKPLAGAAIGVRASYFAGHYSGAQGETDQNGYYEFVVPKGSAHFYNAGYQIEWGEGVAALSLHPSDGKLESWTTVDGAVENFVLLPYGVTSREKLQESSHLPSTFYGGAIILNWYSVEANDESAPAFAVKSGQTLEVTFTPEGKMLDGTAGQTLVVRKTLGMAGSFRIHNIPLGRYRLKITANGKPLKITDSKASPMFGMSPTEAIGEASILFAPASAQASMVGPQFGGWNWIGLTIATP